MQSNQMNSVLWVSLAIAAASLGACSAPTADELLKSGRAHLDKGDAKTAVVEFKQALQRDPNGAEARLLLGRALWAAGDPVSAAIELRKALDGGSAKGAVAPLLAKAMLAMGQSQKVIDEFAGLQLDDSKSAADLDTSLASAHAVLGDTDKARVRLSSALQRQPEFADALVLKARLLLADAKIDDALAQLDAVLARDASDANARMLRGDILLRGKADPAAATAEYLRVLALKPDAVRAHSALITLYLGEKKPDLARAQFDKLKAVAPMNSQTRLHEAQFAVLAKENSKAREIVQGLLKQAPDNVTVLFLAGLIESNLGNPGSAASHLQKLLSINPARADARRLLAQMYLRAGQPEKAFDALKVEANNDKADGQSLALAAQSLLQMGEFERSREMFQRAAKASPDSAVVLTSLAVLNFNAGDQAQALQQLQALTAKDKDTFADQALVSLHAQQRDFAGALAAIDALERKSTEPALAPYLRGRIELQRGDLKAARQHFEAALAKTPTHFASSMALVDLDLEAGQANLAQKRLEVLLAAEPANATVMAELARVRSRAGADKAEVVKRLAEAIKTEPTNLKVRFYLIDFLLARRDAPAAVAAAQDAVTVNPGSEDLLLRLGRSQMQAGNAQQAIGTFRKLAQLKPKSPEPYLRLAEVYSSVKDDAAAETSLRQAVVAFPDSAVASRLLVQHLLKVRKPDAALSVARSLQKQRPKEAGGYLLESEVQMQSKNPEASSKVLRAGLAASDSSELAIRLQQQLAAGPATPERGQFAADWMKSHPRDQRFLRAQAGAEMQRHNYPAAERHYSALIKIDANDAEALNNVAWLSAKLGKPGALGFAERAVALDFNNLAFVDTLAHILLDDKQTPRAVEMAKRVVQSSSTDPVLLLSATDVLVRAGETKLAEVELDKLSKLQDNKFLQSEVKRLRALSAR